MKDSFPLHTTSVTVLYKSAKFFKSE